MDYAYALDDLIFGLASNTLRGLSEALLLSVVVGASASASRDQVVMLTATT